MGCVSICWRISYDCVIVFVWRSGNRLYMIVWMVVILAIIVFVKMGWSHHVSISFHTFDTTIEFEPNGWHNARICSHSPSHLHFYSLCIPRHLFLPIPSSPFPPLSVRVFPSPSQSSRFDHWTCILVWQKLILAIACSLNLWTMGKCVSGCSLERLY